MNASSTAAGSGAATAGHAADEASAADTIANDFVAFSVRSGVLRFGEFRTKAGRNSPYFFNAGLFDDGSKLRTLGRFYARRLLASGLPFDMLYGPAYKGITLAAACAIALAEEGHEVPFAYNRKEAKDHGEGGTLVGAPMKGRVVIVDDVITDGASKRESVDLIRAAGAEPAAVLIAMDRMERGGSDDNLARHSAVELFTREFGLPVLSIATLSDLLQYLQGQADPQLAAHLPRVQAYRARYGAVA
jgi:orotate phosphoribosyltransferase